MRQVPRPYLAHFSQQEVVFLNHTSLSRSQLTPTQNPSFSLARHRQIQSLSQLSSPPPIIQGVQRNPKLIKFFCPTLPQIPNEPSLSTINTHQQHQHTTHSPKRPYSPINKTAKGPYLSPPKPLTTLRSLRLLAGGGKQPFRVEVHFASAAGVTP
jgi:hypothetical protein